MSNPNDDKRTQVTDEAIRDGFSALFATSPDPGNCVINIDEIGKQNRRQSVHRRRKAGRKPTERDLIEENGRALN
jgi:hypothetical protein